MLLRRIEGCRGQKVAADRQSSEARCTWWRVDAALHCAICPYRNPSCAGQRNFLKGKKLILALRVAQSREGKRRSSNLLVHLLFTPPIANETILFVLRIGRCTFLWFLHFCGFSLLKTWESHLISQHHN